MDLTEIADLFVRKAVTGKRLLLLSLHNLQDLGIQSVGHAVEIFVSSSFTRSTYCSCTVFLTVSTVLL